MYCEKCSKGCHVVLLDAEVNAKYYIICIQNAQLYLTKALSVIRSILIPVISHEYRG